MKKILLSEIWIYPLKSARGIPLPAARVTDRGLQYDRRWMLVDEKGKFVSQRQYPRMALMGVSVDNDALAINAPGMPELVVPPATAMGDSLPVHIWKDQCVALSCGMAAQEWFSDFLGVPLRLVYMPDESVRPVDPTYSIRPAQVSFADGYPFLLISEASLLDLNRRLEYPVSMNRFRPNLVVSDCAPYAEDSWKKIQIGSQIFQVVKPCSRCVITTVDQDKGIAGKEPLRTLARYRQVDGKVLFGQNLVHETSGELQVNQEVRILES